MRNHFIKTAAAITALCGMLILSGCSIGLPFRQGNPVKRKIPSSVSAESEENTTGEPVDTAAVSSAEKDKNATAETDTADNQLDTSEKSSENQTSTEETNAQKSGSGKARKANASESSDAERARQQAEQAVQAAKDKADKENALKNEIISWVSNFCSSYSSNDPAGSVSSLFVSDANQDEITGVLAKVSGVSQSSKSRTGIDLVHYDDTCVVAKIYRYNDGDSNVDGFAAGFARNGDALLYSPAVFNQYSCPSCGGTGSVITGSTACAICGGTGQQYIPNMFYDPYMGWYGGYQSCSGCAGSGQIAAYGTCSSCGGWGVHG